jgi:hypothetical protein
MPYPWDDLDQDVFHVHHQNSWVRDIQANHGQGNNQAKWVNGDHLTLPVTVIDVRSNDDSQQANHLVLCQVSENRTLHQVVG